MASDVATTTGVLDPTCALVLVDLQVVTMSFPAAHNMGTVVAHAARLASSFRERALPVVLTVADLNHPPAGRTQFARPRAEVPSASLALSDALGADESDIVLTKSGWGAFQGTDLDETLRARGVTQVVVAGLATGFGVESTARQAYDAGYHVMLVVDAMTGPDLEGHDHTVARVFPALGQVVTTDEVLASLND
ncbi:isochorismatase family protein [Promicromonospora sp. NFX87]|uniref:isochorismatase family protein n=1 Tax=Promicromonospora sp. NFX87 TaxID=3402691 RepID=UPI003AFAF792